jgi:stage IV sporulation protein FB
MNSGNSADIDYLHRMNESNPEATTIVADSVENTFPPKPIISESPFLTSSFISLLLFIGVYILFFDQTIGQIAVLVLVLFIHEMGHFLAMKYFGYSDVKMFFIPFLGAMVTGNKEEISQRQRAIILLAGPVPGIIIGAVLYYVGNAIDSRDMLLTAGMFVFLNAINLLPLNPLDGGRLIETLFFHSKETLKNIFIGISAAAMVFIAVKYEMYTLLILPLALLMRIRQNTSVKELKEALAVKGLDYNKPFSTLTDREYWLIREEVVNRMPGFGSVDGSVYQVSSRERQISDHMKGLAERKVIGDLSAGGIVLFTLMWLIFLAVPAVVVALALYARSVS